LGEFIHTLNRDVEVTYRPAHGRGDPEAISGQRFTDEFDYRPIPIRQRLQEIVIDDNA
jgi:hypothetical protein